MVEFDIRFLGNLNSATQYDTGMMENTIHSKSPCFVVSHTVRHFIRSPTVCAGCTHITWLIERIIRDLRLIEVGSPAVTVPKDLKLLMVFDEETVNSDIIAIYYQ